MKDIVEPLLTSASLAELRARIATVDGALTLPQAKRLQEHARGLTGDPYELRLGIIHTYTSDLLTPWLDFAAALQGCTVDTYHAPYGLAMQEAQPGSDLLQHAPDITVFMLQREDLHPALREPVVGFPLEEQQKLLEQVVDRVIQILRQFRALNVGQLVLTLLPTLSGPALGQYDRQSERSEVDWWARLKSAISGRIREELSATLFLDLDLMLEDLGRDQFFDRRFWFSSRWPFRPRAAQALSQRLVNVGICLKRPKAKVIVLDADNTLWGGVVGEDGLNGIALGPEYPGNLYLEFQRRILEYQQRGFILAICSKNNPADLQQVLDDHPHQLIKDHHLAARRVNWVDKPENLKALAEELNLGLDSFVFVDDSDHECAAVRQLLPQVEVVQTPGKPLLVPGCLDHVARLEILSLTDEDRRKTALYAQERSRRELRDSLDASGGGYEDYLRSLQMRMEVVINDASHLQRLAQLTQKTNQFNLTTRRYDESQMEAFIRSDDWVVGHFSLSDTFGNSGVVGLALCHIVGPETAELDSFLMSCRVIGRRAESVFLATMIEQLRARGITEFLADYLPTAKNALVKDFLSEHGFIESAGRYRLDLSENPALKGAAEPIEVSLA
jgi:FkbH-like protein